MIRANELRIGNYVNITYLLTGKNRVSTIGCQDIVKINDHMLQTFNYSPIAITKEWLLKFGFIPMHGTNGNHYRLGLHFIMIDGLNDFYFMLGRGMTIEIKYVHQLQNLYFALTQTELTIL